jgi:hypothetical protein
LKLLQTLALAMLLAPAAGVHGTRPARPRPERDWTGTYALRLRLATDTHLPLLLGRRASATTSLALAHVRRTPQGWVQEQRACDVRTTAGTPMEFGPAFVAGLPGAQFAATFPEADAPYAADMGVQAIGYDPAVTRGAMPERGDAPGVVDLDHDGQPGATVTGHFPLFGAVRIYFAQRLHLALHGRETRPGRIAGSVQVKDLRQRTLGASSRLFRRTLEVTPDPSGSGFVMVAVGAAFTCDDLRRADASLFG